MGNEVADKIAVILLAGPIKHWWDENWDTPEHWHYDAWRTFLSWRLVETHGYLVYHPHNAWKGDWTEVGQVVNDAALKLAGAVIVMTPPGVPSEGTDSEIKLASSSGAVLVYAPPPATQQEFEDGFLELHKQLLALDIHKDIVLQDTVLDAIGNVPGRTWLFKAMFDHYFGHVIRLHYLDPDGRNVVADAYWVTVNFDDTITGATVGGGTTVTTVMDLLKAEVIARTLRHEE